MGFELATSTLYGLLDAAQLARRALLVPLAPYGLVAGDDAVLLSLQRSDAPTQADLEAQTGLNRRALRGRLERLVGSGLVRIDPVGSSGPRRIGLTDEGADLAAQLRDIWMALDGELKRSRKAVGAKRFGKVLRHFIAIMAG